jgi:hypothetical protein
MFWRPRRCSELFEAKRSKEGQDTPSSLAKSASAKRTSNSKVIFDHGIPNRSHHTDTHRVKKQPLERLARKRLAGANHQQFKTAENQYFKSLTGILAPDGVRTP